MKKFFSLFLMMAVFSTGLFAATYTVAGSSDAAFGKAWDPKNTANDMTLVDGVYTLVKEDVTLPAGTVEYKVCKDYAWTTCWPSGDNAKLEISEAGKYTLTFTFVESTGTVNASAQKTEDAVVDPKVSIKGAWDSWAEVIELKLAEDKKSASYVMEIAKATSYEFKVIVGDGDWRSNEHVFTRDDASTTGMTGNSNTNLKLVADVVGNYTFTWTFDANSLAITFPEKGGEGGEGGEGGDPDPDPEVGTQTIYLNGGGASLWNQADAVFFVHAWGGTEADVKMAQVKGDVYSAAIPENNTNLVFVRMAPGSEKIDWDSKWNQTTELTIPADKDLYTITSWEGGEWSKYDAAGGEGGEGGEGGDTPADPTVVVTGTMTDWAAEIPFELSEDKTKATLFVDNLKVGFPEFKLIVNGEWRSNGKEFSREAPAAAGINYNDEANMKLIADAEGAYTFTWVFANDSMHIQFPEKPAENPAKFYATGNAALVVEAGLDKTMAWNAAAIKSEKDTLELNLNAGSYQLKVTTDGKWDGQKNYKDLTEIADGLTTDDDNNICFELDKKSLIKVIYFVQDAKATFKLLGDFYVAPVVEPAKFYVTGDSALVVDAGLEASKAWAPDAIESKEETMILKLKAKQPYQLKITLDGDWGTGKGYQELTEKQDGLTTDADNNICFELNEAGQVQVIYTEKEFKLIGNFYVAPKPIPVVKIAGTWKMEEESWIQQLMTNAEDNLSASIKMTLEEKKYDFKMIIDDAWMGQLGDGGPNKNQYVVNRGWPKVDNLFSEGAENILFEADEAGEYTFVYTYANGTLTVSFPDKTIDPEAKYYMRNGWNGGDWTWKEMTKQEDGTFKLENVVFGGNGVNYNTAEAEEGQGWVALENFQGDEIGALDTVTLVLDPSKPIVTATLLGKYVPVLPYVAIVGEMNGWDGAKNQLIPAEDKQTATAVINLEMNDKYGYEIKLLVGDKVWSAYHDGSDWYGIGRDAAPVKLNWVADDSDPIWLSMDMAGEYTFTYNYADNTLLVVFPEKGDTPEPPTPDVIYSVAGSKAILGAEWNEKEGNEMTLDPKDGLYKLFCADVTLAAGTEYKFKIVTNHNWSNPNYPDQDKIVTVEKDGKYDVTITFNAETKDVAYVAEFKGGAVIEKHYLVVGADAIANGEDWNNDADVNEMKSADEGKTYTLVVTGAQLIADMQYGYKIVEKGTWTEYFPNNAGANAYLSVKESAVYTITYTYTVADATCAVVTTKTGELPEARLKDGYYLAGTFNGVDAWTVADLNESKLFTYVEGNEDYELLSVTAKLTVGDKLKAVAIEHDVIKFWLPDGQNTEIEVTANYAGDAKNIYIRTDKKTGYLYIWIEPNLYDGYYLVGTMNAWTPSKEYLFMANPDNAYENVLTATLAENDEFKVVYVSGGEKIESQWYPAGETPNYIVDANHAGKKEIYFRDDYNGGEGWFYGCIFIAPNETTGISNTAVDGKAVKTISNGMLIIEKAGVRYNVMGQIIR